MEANIIRQLNYIFAAGALCCGAAQAEPAAPAFKNVTQAADVSHVHGGGDAFVVGGGAAAFDCSGDGSPDLAMAGGDAPLALWRNVSATGGSIRFAPVDMSRITRVTDLYPFDFDADGEADLFVLRFGRNALLRGFGGCRFEDATDAPGLPERADRSTAFAATWEEGETLPTLFVGNCVPRDRPLQASGNCEASYLLRPDGGGYGAPVPLSAACTLSALFVDWSGTGRRDLRLANDRAYYDSGMGEELWRLTPEGAARYGAADGWRETSIWGMGLAAHDLDGDQKPEIAVTNMADNRLEALAGAGPAYGNEALGWNAMAQRPYAGGDVRPSTAWHVDFADFNNDGRRDLWIVKGNVDAMPEHAAFDPDNLPLRDGDRFVEAGARAGIALDARGRGGAAADFNGDGALDLAVVNREEPALIFEAERPLGRWLAIDPRMEGPNRFAVDARVEVWIDGRIEGATRSVGGGHGGGSLTPLHFGLGDAEAAEARGVWPDGTASPWRSLAAGRAHTIRKEGT